MGSGRPTRHFCYSSTAEGYKCYILRAIFAGFIGGSSPDATVEGTRRPISRWPFPMVAGFLLGASSTGKLAGA